VQERLDERHPFADALAVVLSLLLEYHDLKGLKSGISPEIEIEFLGADE